MVDASFYPAVWLMVAPSTSTSAGKKGQMFVDSSYLYICYADNLWKRITLESF